MYKQALDRDWKLRHEQLYFDPHYYAVVVNREDGWLDVASLPCDVHIPLIANGTIGDPVVADHCFQSVWIEDKSWWFKKVFQVDDTMLASQNSELVIERLDVKADIFLNGLHLGHHRSETYPFRKDVRDVLAKGENVLVVRVTPGLEYFTDLDSSKIHWKGEDYVSGGFTRSNGARRDHRRVFVRKPQYVYGWDWNPRIATCGMMGDAGLEAYDEVAVRSIKCTTVALMENCAQLRVEAEIENLYPITTLDAAVELDISFNGERAGSFEKDVFLTCGVNYVSFDITIENPHLWWPSGMGEQHLYSIKVSAVTSNRCKDERECMTGIRTVKWNTDKIGPDSRLFALEINGIRTFCKGGNWETPDSIYGRVTSGKYDKLVKEAKEANFNMLRFNGVNAYEYDEFYDCCDRYGIMVWQDFIFSCAAYPDEQEWFRHEVEREVDYQIKRLRNHPCIVLWCGNNECQISLEGYGKYSYLDPGKPAFPRGVRIYNEVIPRLVRELCADVPYWNSSPFGGVDLNSPAYGDRHPWGECFMHDDIQFRITPEHYDRMGGRFVSEFGCVGPTKKSSLYKYYGSERIDVGSDIWKLHTNEFELDTVEAAIRKHYTNPESLSLDEYLLYAGLFQGLMLGYGFESLRHAEHNYGALIWSYNDCWGEVGWSIIDYYAARKISYYFVKRALAHTKLIMREHEGEIRIICMNDTRHALEFDLEYGYTTFDGSKRDTAAERVTVASNTKSAVVARLNKGSHSGREGVYYAKPDKRSGIVPAILRMEDFRTMGVSRPVLQVAPVAENEGECRFEVSSDVYAHGVHFGFDDEVLLSDEYFDLLPGESRTITVQGCRGPERIQDVMPRSVYVRD